MKRRRSKLASKPLKKSKRKPVYLPKSDDSGVSLESPKDEMKGIDLGGNSNSMDMGNKVTNNNLKISIDSEKRIVQKESSYEKESIIKPLGTDIHNDIALPAEEPRSDRSHYSFEDDAQSCLDYEPYDDEPEDYVDSPRQPSPLVDDDLFQENSHIPEQPQDNQNLCSEGVEEGKDPQDNYSSDHFNDICTEVQEKLYDIRNSIIDTNSVDSPKFSPVPAVEDATENQDNESVWDENDETLINNDSNADPAEYDCQENEDALAYQEPQDDNCDTERPADLFKNAKFNFKGTLNITITRPVINNAVTANKDLSNSVMITENKLLSSVTEPTPSPAADTSRLAVTRTATSAYDIGERNHADERKWPRGKINLNAMKITSRDDIFLYNKRIQFTTLMGALSWCSRQSEVSSLNDESDFPRHQNDLPLKSFHHGPYDPPCNNISNGNYYSDNLFDRKSPIKIQPELRNSSASSISSGNEPSLPYSKITHSFSDQNVVVRQGSSTCSATSFESMGSSLKLPLKRPPSRPKKRSIEDEVASELPDDDAMSILAKSSILDDGAQTSEIDENENDKDDFVNRWLMQTCQNDDDLIQLLESLCEPYFKNSSCHNSRCTRTHKITDVARRIKELSPEKLAVIYKLSQEKTFWYLSLFEVFVDCFEKSSELNRVMLVDMVNDVFVVFEGTFTDKTSYILKIITALKNTGLSFKEAIEMIIVRHGTSHISICDILLFIISKESNLEDHWVLVKKITSCRREKIDHEVVIHLLYVALNNYPPNKQLCAGIFNDIFQKNLVDSDKIPPSLLTSMRTVVKIPRRPNGTLASEQPAVNVCNPQRSPGLVQNPLAFDFRGDAFPPKTTQRSPGLVQNPLALDFRTDAFPPETRGSASTDSSDNSGAFNNSPVLNGSSYNPTYLPTHLQNADDFSSYSDSGIGFNKDGTYLFDRPSRPNRSFRQSMNSSSMNVAPDRFSPIANAQTTEQDVFKVPVDFAPKKRPRVRDRAEIKLSNRDQIQLSNRDPPPESASPFRKVFIEDVLRRINQPLHLSARPQTPANIVAHPSRQIVISPQYECNFSLHNLHPVVQVCSTEISNVDLHRLRRVLDEMDGAEFLNILEDYRNSFTIENFILNTLTLITSSSVAMEIFRKFMSLLTAIEKIHRDWMEMRDIKMLVEVLAMNVVYSLENKGEWKRCRDILLRVKYLHSVVTSKIFFCRSHLISHMHRYIYIIAIFIRAEDFHWANELFQGEVPNLLEFHSKWPYQYVPSDVQARNQALKLFFEEGLALNIVAANDLLKHITVVLGGCVEGFDVWNLFDNFMCARLDAGEQSRSSLELLFRDVLHSYGRYMDNNVLQGYLMYMESAINYRDAFQLFRICCEKGIYHKYTGMERVVIIKTTMTDFEITALLECYFENIVNRSVSPHTFHIELKLPQSNEPTSPQILKNRLNRSVFAVFTSILNVLRVKYNILIEQSLESKILVTQEMQESLFRL